MKRPLYHAQTYTLLDLQPIWRDLPWSITTIAQEHQIALPAAYAELCQIEGANALLFHHSNMDSFAIETPTVVRDSTLGALLMFMIESQGNFELAVVCSEQPDPPVYYRDFTHARWIRYADSFSAAIYTQIFDWQFLRKQYGEHWDLSYVSIECPFVPQILSALDRHATREPTTHWYLGTDEGTIFRYRLTADTRLTLNNYNRMAYICVSARGDTNEAQQAAAAVKQFLGTKAASAYQESRAMSTYADLGLRPIINAAATLTRLGGSRMPAAVVAAMAVAADAFIDLVALQERVGARIAELTHNEACYVSSGAAAGISIAVAACITGENPAAIASFPYPGQAKSEVIIHRSQRNSYDYAIRQTGARLIEIGTPQITQPADLQAAIRPQTACIVYFAGAHYAAGSLPLAEVIAIAQAAQVPVIVDAAAQIPPIANLWHFTRDQGADLVVFSGGKGLRGPQSAGLVLGRAALVTACRLNGNPNESIGRPMKVGKEELIGMLAAVEWSLAQDETALLERYEQLVQYWLSHLCDLPGIKASRGYPSEAGQPHARVIVQISPTLGQTRDQLVVALLHGDPAVAVGSIGSDSIALNPQTIEPGEEQLVLAALKSVLEASNHTK